jgi:hypothetical protein
MSYVGGQGGFRGGRYAKAVHTKLNKHTTIAAAWQRMLGVCPQQLIAAALLFRNDDSTCTKSCEWWNTKVPNTVQHAKDLD